MQATRLENLTDAVIERNVIVIVVKVIIFVIREFFSHLAKTGDLLLHVDAGDAVGVQHLVEVGDDKTFQVEV